jgi:hypothetical protein
LSGVVRWSRFAFNVVAWLFVACVAYQVYLPVRVFSASDFETHRGFAIFAC